MGGGRKMIVAGGGTGGHLFPGIAIAEEFLGRDPANRVLFVGTERGLEKRVLSQMGYTLETLDVEGVKGRGLAQKFGALAKIPRSLAQSRRILRQFGPDIVVGVGGYASGPAVLMAHWMGLPTAIAEQNAIPGATNRILARFADRIFLTFADERGEFPPAKIRVTGNPVRAAFAAAGEAVRDKGGAAAGTRHDEGAEDTAPVRPFTLLIFGGSQGAHAINRTVMEAVSAWRDLADLNIIHQTGPADLEAVRQAYRDAGREADIRPFIMDMAAVAAAADLIVCRAGATSIAEITAMGKAAILIPFPYAIADHQTRNAEVLARSGAAELIPERDLTAARLAAAVRRYVNDPAALRRMAARSAALGNTRAARDIVDACLALLQK
jgi:UDP-N-acetylglucosamine--N-acetylmuramyl-(pentapeptide) pyrophosphoryl-undecaprenol N-acetylglucosamine transferase